MMTSVGFAHPAGINASSDNDTLISLLMYQNDWMVWFASLVVAIDDADNMALDIIQYVASSITYTADVTDEWKYPKATIFDACGDCEDGAFLLASLMLNAGIDPSRVRVYTGLYSGIGHSWVEYRRASDEQWITLDWTHGGAYWVAISSLSDLPPTYPTETHLYASANNYVTFEGVVELTGDGYILSLQATYAALTLPMQTCAAATQNSGSAEVTLPTMTAAGMRGNLANASLKLPLLIADGRKGELTASLSERLPMLTISARATQANLIALAKSLPALKMSGCAYQQNYGDVDADLPAFTISATSYEDLKGDLSASLPMMTVYGEASSSRRFSDRILKHDYDAWGFVEAEIPILTISAGAS
jgi:hypothetical protein